MKNRARDAVHALRVRLENQTICIIHFEAFNLTDKNLTLNQMEQRLYRD